MGGFGRRIFKAIDYLTKIQLWLAGAAMMACIFLIGTAVVMRYVFRDPPNWMVELPAFSMLFIVALALPFVQKAKGHVAVDAAVSQLPPGLRRVVDVIANILYLGYVSFLTQAFWVETADHLESGKASIETKVPFAILTLVVALGLFGFCLQLVLDIVRSLIRLSGKEPGGVLAERAHGLGGH